MHKINGAGATSNNEFQDIASPGTPGTRLLASWLNTIQRELINILAAANITPDTANDSQVLAAINYLISQSSGGGGGGGGSAYWIDAVANPGSLPAGKPTGSIGLSVSDLSLYRYNGSAWVLYVRPTDYAPAASAVTLTGTQTMTNKTLTAPQINAPTGIVKSDVGLGNVDNTSDANKPVSTAQQTALNLKLDAAQKAAANGVATLGADSKIPIGQIPTAVVGQVHYQGTFVPASGYPSSPSKGDYYIASASGTAGGTQYDTGDWAIYNGTSWDKIDNTDAVSSVNGKLGAVTLITTDIAEGTNKYYTDKRAQDAIGTTIASSASINQAYNSTTGVITSTVIPSGIDINLFANVLGYTKGGTAAANQLDATFNTGGYLPKVISTSETIVPGRWYLANTFAGAFGVTLPPIATSLGFRLKFSDSYKEYWDINNFTITPFSGDTIGTQSANAPLICNVKRGWVELYCDGNTWVVLSLGSTASGVISQSQGEKNYLGASANGIGGWILSGSMALTIDTTAANIPDQSTQGMALKFLATGVNATASRRFTLDQVDLLQRIKYQLDMKYAGAANDYKIEIYSSTTSNYTGGVSSNLNVTPTTSVPVFSGQIKRYFNAPDASAMWLTLVITSNVASPQPLYVNNFIVGPGQGNNANTAGYFQPALIAVTGTTDLNTVEELDVSANTVFTRTLPIIPAQGGSVSYMISKGQTSATNYVRISPNSNQAGQTIDDMTTADSYLLDYNGWVTFFAGPGATSWKSMRQATTMAQGGQIPGQTLGVATSAGFIGELIGTLRAGTGGATYTDRSSTAISGTGNSVLSRSLNKGVYLLCYMVSGYISSGAPVSFWTNVSVGGSGVLAQRNSTMTGNSSQFMINDTVPLLISADNTTVSVNAAVPGSGGTTSASHEMAIVRIG